MPYSYKAIPAIKRVLFIPEKEIQLFEAKGESRGCYERSAMMTNLKRRCMALEMQFPR